MSIPSPEDNDTQNERLVPSKKTGSFYTPLWIAEKILLISGYDVETAIGKNVIDPSCGDGALLVPIVKVLSEALACQNIDKEEAETEITAHIHGIELIDEERLKCMDNLSKAVEEFGFNVPAEKFDIRLGNAFDVSADFRDSMDYVIGNPPYIRIHNYSDKPESAYMRGMCDLYLGFYDIGQHMLLEGGSLAYIAPSSWFSSSSGASMRENFKKRKIVSDVCDLKHLQVFSDALVYTAIVRLTTSPNDEIRLWNIESDSPSIVLQESCWSKGTFSPDSTDATKEILSFECDGKIRVKNGYATLRDNLYVSDSFPDSFDPFVIECVKGTTVKKHEIIYPYREDGSVIPFEEIKAVSPSTADYLESIREELSRRSKIDSSEWWSYGRSQGVADTFQDKVAVQSMAFPGVPPRTMNAPKGTGVYAGLYVIGTTKEKIDEALSKQEFFDYIASLKKYKSGGYFAFGSKDLEKFLSWNCKNN